MNTSIMENDLKSFMKQVETLDQDALFELFHEQVESGKKDSYMDAVSDYIEENDLSEKEIKAMIGSSLKQFILKEASALNLLHPDAKISRRIDSFFM